VVREITIRNYTLAEVWAGAVDFLMGAVDLLVRCWLPDLCRRLTDPAMLPD
jgi:hypothetical protein